MKPTKKTIIKKKIAKSKKQEFSFAVISDLHAYDPTIPEYKDNPPSHFTINSLSSIPNHPVFDLFELIEKQKLETDFLLCAGDIGHQAHPNHIAFAWETIHKIGEKLKCKKIIATSGNHDIDSRYNHNNFDAKGLLLSLNPPFPFSTENENNKYWARNYAIIEDEGYRIVVLNSAAYHGMGKKDEKKYVPPEYFHGRISQYTIKALKADFEKRVEKPINILLCHHHPFKHDGISIEDSSTMKGGSDLIDILGSASLGEWLIVHGHRHIPAISYATGGGQSPIAFSAGSFSANLGSPILIGTQNQFYIITININEIEKFNGLVGKFKAWDWIYNNGWVPPSVYAKLPMQGGFGIRDKIKKIAKQVDKHSKKEKNIFTNWEDIKSHIPEIKYLIPRDLSLLVRTLKDKPYNFSPELDSHGQIRRLYKE